MAFDEKEYKRQWYSINRERILEMRKKYSEENDKKIREYHAEYYQNNRNELLEKQKEYAEENKNKRNEYLRSRFITDISYNISCNLRKRLNKAIKNNYKTGSAVEDLGCSIEEFKIRLEKQFYINKETGETMTWKNYGLCGWHIDHIIPLSSFDLINREQFLKACHYTNPQPLWAKENLQKNNRLDWVKK